MSNNLFNISYNHIQTIWNCVSEKFRLVLLLSNLLWFWNYRQLKIHKKIPNVIREYFTFLPVTVFFPIVELRMGRKWSIVLGLQFSRRRRFSNYIFYQLLLQRMWKTLCNITSSNVHKWRVLRWSIEMKWTA